MDPFRSNFLSDEEIELGSYDRVEGSERYSSEDDIDEIDEIEEALLQRIHYAEDCQGDSYLVDTAPFPAGGGEYVGENFGNITFKSLGSPDAKAERTGVASEANDVVDIPKREEHPSLGSDKSERTRESLAYIPESNSTEMVDERKRAKKRKKKRPGDGESSSTRKEGDSDSEKESKYKMIKSRKTSIKISGNYSDSEVQIVSDRSDEDVISSSGKVSETNQLIRNDVDVVSITCRDGDSEIGFHSDSEIVLCQVSQSPKADDDAELLPPATKRPWQKSKVDPEISDPGLTTTRKKVKLKRTIIDMELRTVLDTIAMEEDSSGDDFSDTLLVESHSEDDAMDVHYDTVPTPGRGYNQSWSYERTSSRGRYYKEPEGWPRYKCYNCLEFGHMSKDCPKPRQRKFITCVLCGAQGHSDRQCPDALCYVCSEPGHQSRECPNKERRYLTCRRCSVKGHTEELCPDRWRQYHLTTEPGKILCDDWNDSGEKYKQLVAVNGKVFCYNCSREGHFGHECWEEPMNRHAPLILPYVVKYDIIPKRFWRVQMDNAEPPERWYNDQAPNQEVESTAPSTVTKKLRAKTKRRLAREAKAALAAANAEVESVAPSTAQKQEKKAKRKRKQADAKAAKVAKVESVAPSTAQKQGRKAKRKREQADDTIAIDDEDLVRRRRAKKCRQKTAEELKEELQDNEKLDEELSTLPMKERWRKMGENQSRRRKEALDREEVLDDYEETDEYVQKGGHILRKRKESERKMYIVDLNVQRPCVKTELAGTEKWKRKKPNKRIRQKMKQQRQELKQQRQELKRLKLMQQQGEEQQPRQLSPQQQRVTFQPDSEQFAELERNYQTRNPGSSWVRQGQDCIEQVNSAGTGPSEAPAVNETSAGGGRKNQKRSTTLRDSRQDNRYRNFQHSLLADRGLPQPMSRKQHMKQAAGRYEMRRNEAYKEHRAWMTERRGAGRRFTSNRGFKIEPDYW